MTANIMRNRDEGHLYALSICHYVLAGMNVFSGCVPLIHVTLGISMLVGAFNGGRNPPPPEMGLLFTVIGGSISLFHWTLAVVNFLGARFLGQRTHPRFCFVIAIIECFQMPQGTVLAVFTLLVLSRDSVKALFAGVPARAPRPVLDDMDDAAPAPKKPDDGAIREGNPSNPSGHEEHGE
jgi:hypothetical protein